MSPFDGALEVGLADCAVIYEYRRAGTELFGQGSWGHLQKGDHLGRITPDIQPTPLLEGTFKSLRDLCNCFSFSLELQCKGETL